MKKSIFLLLAITGFLFTNAQDSSAQTFNYEVSNDGNGWNVLSSAFDTLTNTTTVQIQVVVWITGETCHFEKVCNTSYQVNTTDYTEALRYAPKYAYIYVEENFPCKPEGK